MFVKGRGFGLAAGCHRNQASAFAYVYNEVLSYPLRWRAGSETMSTNGSQGEYASADGWRTQPMYSFAEAGKLAGVSTNTVRNWLLGYSQEEWVSSGEGRVRQERAVALLFNTMPADSTMVSFLQLVEIVVAARFRLAERKSFQVVKRAYENAQEVFNLPFPFAHLQLKAIGGHIVHELREGSRASYQALDVLEQWSLPGIVDEVLSEQIKYEDELAARWYPRGYDVPIVLDPRITSGAPTIEGCRVTVLTIYKRWKDQQQPIEFIANDFGLEPATVERALQYWEKAAA